MNRRRISPELESFAAVVRCLRLHRGPRDTYRLYRGLLDQFGARDAFALSPFAANFCRKILEKLLPMDA